MKTFQPIIVATVAMFVSSCVVTDVGNPQTSDDREASVEFIALEGSDMAALTLSNGVELESATLNVVDLGFRDQASCGRNSNQLDSSWLVELTKAPTKRMLSDVPGRACAIQLRLEPDADTPFSYQFIFSVDGESVVIEDSAPLNVVFAGEETFNVDPSSHFFFVLYSDEWLMDLDLPTDRPSENGNGGEMFQHGFRSNLAKSFRIVPDRTSNGALDMEDLEMPVARATRVNGMDVGPP